jgi:hypothetical protein
MSRAPLHRDQSRGADVLSDSCGHRHNVHPSSACFPSHTSAMSPLPQTPARAQPSRHRPPQPVRARRRIGRQRFGADTSGAAEQWRGPRQPESCCRTGGGAAHQRRVAHASFLGGTMHFTQLCDSTPCVATHCLPTATFAHVGTPSLGFAQCFTCCHMHYQSFS